MDRYQALFPPVARPASPPEGRPAFIYSNIHIKMHKPFPETSGGRLLRHRRGDHFFVRQLRCIQFANFIFFLCIMEKSSNLSFLSGQFPF